MSATVGLSCYLARNTGSYETPVWDDVDNARDVTLTLESTEADASRRGGGGWAEAIQGLHNATIEVEMVHDNEDSQYQAFRSAWMARTPVDMLCLDGPISEAGSQGLRAVMAIFNFTRNEPLDDTVTTTLSMRPTPNSDGVPAWYTAEGDEETTEGA